MRSLREINEQIALESDEYRWRKGDEVPETEDVYELYQLAFDLEDGCWGYLLAHRNGRDWSPKGNPHAWRKIEPPPSFEEEETK